MKILRWMWMTVTLLLNGSSILAQQAQTKTPAHWFWDAMIAEPRTFPL